MKTKKAAAKKAAPVKKVAVKKAPAKKKTVSKKASHIISEAAGKNMTDRFLSNLNSLGNIVFSSGLEFDKSLFQKLLSLKDVHALRIFNAVTDKMQHTFVITAVNKKGKTLFLKQANNLKTTGTKSKGAMAAAPPPTDNGVGNMGSQCPAY
jgi:hypothetical protein